MTKNSLKTQTLIRGLLMLMYGFIWTVAEIVLAATAVFQLIAVLLGNKPNENLRNFGESLSSYLYQIARYVTFNTDTRPFPFGEWPSGNT